MNQETTKPSSLQYENKELSIKLIKEYESLIHARDNMSLNKDVFENQLYFIDNTLITVSSYLNDETMYNSSTKKNMMLYDLEKVFKEIPKTLYKISKSQIPQEKKKRGRKSFSSKKIKN